MFKSLKTVVVTTATAATKAIKKEGMEKAITIEHEAMATTIAARMIEENVSKLKNFDLRGDTRIVPGAALAEEVNNIVKEMKERADSLYARAEVLRKACS